MSLWEFAVQLYRAPGVERQCLEWQSRGGDVCVLLCAAWLEQRAVPYSRARHQALEQLALPWQREVVTPLRALRQNWKARAESDQALSSLREHVKALELEAERELLKRLQSLAQVWPADHAPSNWLGPLSGERSADLTALRLTLGP